MMMRGSYRTWGVISLVALAGLVSSVAYIGWRSQSQVYIAGQPFDLSAAAAPLTPTSSPQPTASPSAPSTPAAIAASSPALETEVAAAPTQGSSAAPESTSAAAMPAASTLAAATETPAATAIAPPTARPAPTPTLIAQPEVGLFYDDFSRISSGWDPFYLNATSDINGYSAGRYAFDIIDLNHMLYDIQQDSWTAQGVSAYAIDMHYMAGSGSFGVLLNVLGEPSDPTSLSYYRVATTTQGALKVEQFTQGTSRLIADRPPGTLAISSRDPLHLEMSLVEGELRVMADQNVLLVATGIEGTNGSLGLFAESAEQPLRVAFDNVLAVARRPNSASLCADIRPLFAGVLGEDVRLLQRRLEHLGYQPNAQANIYDTSTAAAVAEFQESNGLEQSGIVDQQTWCRLLSSEAIVSRSGATEQAARAADFRSVDLDVTAGLPAPIVLSVRQQDKSWRIGLGMPGRTQLYYIETEGDAFDPAWSPDRQTIVFTSERSGTAALWMLKLRERSLTQITPTNLESQFASWSPDSRALLYTAEPSGGESLAARDYVYDVATGQTQQLDDEQAGWADWSVTNDIVVSRYTGKSFDLFRLNPNDGSQINLTHTDDINEDIPAWSPDGSQIAFVGNPRPDPQQRQIFIMQRDGSNIRQLTTIPGPNSNPVWAPDGETIVFANQPSDEVRQPWLIDVYGGNLRQLSQNADRIWFMHWLTPYGPD